jgi:glycosyltransferase involved in cell wall biosynthesis
MKRAVIYFGFQNPRKHKRGVENVISVQAHALPHYNKYYIYFDTEADLCRWDDVVAIGIKHSPARFLTLNVLVSTLTRRLEKRGYQVIIHSHNYLMSLFLWRKTDIFTVHDGLWYQKITVGSRIPSFFYWIERLAYSRVRFPQCDSEFTYRNSLLGACRRTAKIIHCSTPLERLEAQGTRHPNHFAPHDSYMILSVRSMEPRSRIDLLLDVAEQAQNEGTPWVFVVAGKGPMLAYYQNDSQQRGLKNIHLLGFVNDLELAKLYAGSDCVLMTCEHGEGFGLPVIEGYLFGKPVIASNRCAVPEVIQSPTCLVENEALAIKERLLRLTKDPRRPELYRTYYKDNFGNRVIEDRFRQAYTELFSGMHGCA